MAWIIVNGGIGIDGLNSPLWTFRNSSGKKGVNGYEAYGQGPQEGERGSA